MVAENRAKVKLMSRPSGSDSTGGDKDSQKHLNANAAAFVPGRPLIDSSAPPQQLCRLKEKDSAGMLLEISYILISYNTLTYSTSICTNLKIQWRIFKIENIHFYSTRRKYLHIIVEVGTSRITTVLDQMGRRTTVLGNRTTG